MRGFDDKSGVDSYLKGKSQCVVKFTQKNVFSTKNNPICGITFWKWLMILRKYVTFIEWQYYPRALFITLLSIFNTILGVIEHYLYWDQIRKINLPDNPVFIVGHPRTGTTLLHNLLSTDEENFFYCSTFCAGFPSSFLFFENIGKQLLSGIIDKTRPMDSMPLHFDLPQEDECASNVLSAGLSFYMPLWFMRQEKDFRKYLDFDENDGATSADKEKWCEAFLYLLKKLCLRQLLRKNKHIRSADGRLQSRLLLKSPIHTARIPLLRELFPNAQFIYIHRHPEDVFCSAVHMADTAYWFCYLNTPCNEQVLEFILWQFEQLWIKYDAAVNSNVWRKGNGGNGHRKSLGNVTKKAKSRSTIVSWNEIRLENVSDRRVSKDIIEISYEDLTTRCTETLDRVYSFLDLVPSESQGKIILEAEMDLKLYKKNVHGTLDKAVKAMIKDRWADYYDAFKYK